MLIQPLLLLALLCLWGAAAPARAACSRPIQVPMADLASGVVIDGDRLAGVYPTVLREMGPAIGCDFVLKPVPRARQQKLLEAGQADIMLPAVRSPIRDQHGEFVPLMQLRAGLMGFDRSRPPLRSLSQVLAHPDLRVAVVRGFSYGALYEDAIAQLRAQRRLVEEVDATAVVRALRKGLAQATIMAPYVLQGTLLRDVGLAPLNKELRIELLEDLPWGETGAYLSLRSLADADREYLRQAFGKVAKSGRVQQLFGELAYPGSVNPETLRPLP